MRSGVAAAAAPALAMALVLALAGCVTVPAAQRLVEGGNGSAPTVLERPCGSREEAPPAHAQARALPDPLRLASWNLHKDVDPGWQVELARIAAASDVVLLQEASLGDELARTLEDAGMRWQLAGGFLLEGHDAGVLTATRAQALDACTVRAWEPLLQVPKAALITRFRVEGHAGTLAIANLHGINFTLSAAGAYREQLEAVRAELATHAGPIVLAGDFNTWSDERLAAVEAVARELGLVAVAFHPDARARFFDHPVDHVFVRGIDVIDAKVVSVASSDHNPLFATLHVR